MTTYHKSFYLLVVIFIYDIELTYYVVLNLKRHWSCIPDWTHV